MQLNCPSCKSENTQRLAVVHESGISQIHSKTGGIGLGVGRGGLSVGVGKASTASSAQTAVSQRVAPPQKKRYFKPLLWMFLGWVVVALGVSSIRSPVLSYMVSAVWLAGSAAWIYHAVQYNFKAWPVQIKVWQDSFMCHRCNHLFVAQ